MHMRMVSGHVHIGTKPVLTQSFDKDGVYVSNCWGPSSCTTWETHPLCIFTTNTALGLLVRMPATGIDHDSGYRTLPRALFQTSLVKLSPLL